MPVNTRYTPLDGRRIAGEKLQKLKEAISQSGAMPVCAIVLIGSDHASQLYVRSIEKTAKEIGIEMQRRNFDKDVIREEVLTHIDVLNSGPAHGIIVQLPLPKHLSPDEVIARINPEKDVDGFHPVNQKKFLSGEERIYPAFPRAIVELLRDTKENLNGKTAVFIGKSPTFGRVMITALQREGMRVKFIPCS